MKAGRLAGLLLFWGAASISFGVQAAGFDEFVVFGDSTWDSGYFRYHTIDNGGVMDQAVEAAVAAGAGGGFVGTGTMVSTFLAEKFGLIDATIDAGGYNYANGGAHTVSDSAPNVSAIQQIESYLALVNGAVDANALYIVSAGNNDLLYVTNQGEEWIAANPTYLPSISLAFAEEIAKLQTSGAETIVVPNSFFSAVMAELGGDIDPAYEDQYERAVAYYAGLWADLTAEGVNFVPADLDSVFSYVVHNPTLFGFTASSVLASSSPCLGTPALFCTSMTDEQMQEYLFVDGKHLATAGQLIEADYIYSLLTAPSQISLINEAAIQSGLTRAGTIQTFADFSSRKRGPSGINTWISMGANALRITNAPGFPDDPGVPFYGSVGVDYKISPTVIVGAVFSAGSQRQSFSTGGHYDQSVQAPGLYAAYRDGPVWGDAIISYGFHEETIVRDVKLGVYTDRNVGKTTGRSLALAVRGGKDFALGPSWTIGPIGGVVAQTMRLKGYTETGTSTITALSFGSQQRDSLISQLGVRGSVDLGEWRPFAQMLWNHEWYNAPGRASASITTASAASYTTQAAPRAADWGTASVGVSYELEQGVDVNVIASGLFLNDQITSYGGEIGLTFRF